MATAPDSHESVHECAASEAQLKVSAYDKAASMLIACLIVVGILVLVLMTIWLTGRLLLAKAPVQVDWLLDEGRSDRAPGFAQDMDEPGIEDMEELKEPQIEATLEVVEQVITEQASALAAIESNAAITSRGPGPGQKQRVGSFHKKAIDDVIPPHERWEIRFSTAGIQTYARQLDFFKIELGAVGGGSPQVDYAGNLSKIKPDRRRGDSEDEQRLYMSWQKDSGSMSAFDRQLLARAGIQTERRLVLQFYPQKIEELLSRLEAQEAQSHGHTDPRSFLKTVFGVRPIRGGHAFYVKDQYFRPVPAS
ncbi:MAG: hypothetical protein H8E44_22140 [Planctomycetes bacterium]|nr:hypothetical protein [Planctomycetota bacterium]